MIKKYGWLILSITFCLGLLICFNTAKNDSDSGKLNSIAVPVSKSAPAANVSNPAEISIVNMEAEIKPVTAQTIKEDKPPTGDKASQPVSQSLNKKISNNTKEAEVKSVAVHKVNEDKPPVTVKAGQPVSQSLNKNISDSTPVSRGQTNTDINKYPKLSKVNVTVTLPGLNIKVPVHKSAAENFIMAFNYINNGTAMVNGKQVPLLSLIETMDGTYVTRHVNWDPNKGLSNHSWGTAIDINARDHFRYVDSPSDPNLILWEKAFKPAGFSWGNRYNDSMHYELIK